MADVPPRKSSHRRCWHLTTMLHRGTNFTGVELPGWNLGSPDVSYLQTFVGFCILWQCIKPILNSFSRLAYGWVQRQLVHPLSFQHRSPNLQKSKVWSMKYEIKIKIATSEARQYNMKCPQAEEKSDISNYKKMSQRNLILCKIWHQQRVFFFLYLTHLWHIFNEIILFTIILHFLTAQNWNFLILIKIEQKLGVYFYKLFNFLFPLLGP